MNYFTLFALTIHLKTPKQGTARKVPGQGVDPRGLLQRLRLRRTPLRPRTRTMARAGSNGREVLPAFAVSFLRGESDDYH